MKKETPAGSGRVLLRKHEAATALALSMRKLELLINEGEIHTVRLGRRCVRVPLAEVHRFAQRHTAPSAP